jgi:hypothetical protein
MLVAWNLQVNRVVMSPSGNLTAVEIYFLDLRYCAVSSVGETQSLRECVSTLLILETFIGNHLTA